MGALFLCLLYSSMRDCCPWGLKLDGCLVHLMKIGDEETISSSLGFLDSHGNCFHGHLSPWSDDSEMRNNR